MRAIFADHMAEPNSQLAFEQLRDLAREDGFEVVNL